MSTNVLGSAGKRLPFTVAIDTREQRPYAFADCDTLVCTLATGDYSIVGLSSRITVERKTRSDFYGSLSAQRFRDVLERMREMGPNAVVCVEATQEQMYRQWYTYVSRGGKRKRGRMGPALVHRLTNDIMGHGVHVWFAGDRKGGEAWTRRWLYDAWERIQEETR